MLTMPVGVPPGLPIAAFRGINDVSFLKNDIIADIDFMLSDQELRTMRYPGPTK